MRVAGIQAAPIFLDRQATLDKMLSLIAEAAREGAELCAFPEVFLSGYPAWLSLTGGARFNDDRQKEAYAVLLDQAVRLDGPEVRALERAAREHRIFVYAGMSERGLTEHQGRGTVYCTLLAIDPQRGVVNVHRKLKPTYEERLVWGDGDGGGLRVLPYQGWRIGGLICWENWMPLARTALYAQGEELHVSVWPGNPSLVMDNGRFVALEGRVYVLAVCGILRAEDIPPTFPLREDMLAHGNVFYRGGTSIFAPDGTLVAGPLVDVEGIVYADIDSRMVSRERQNFDPTGHYARPDVFRLRVDRRRRLSVSFRDGPGDDRPSEKRSRADSTD
ncbi:MAG TPA: carbon-nitrogen hydrolase family protein [Blastocatellia bacterium]|nr:carbon-nitrogen hydrolase family protein [Blastocatellia bacterium]